MHEIFDAHESAVRSYVRAFPDVFVAAKGARLTGRSGRSYIDFFAGAGALNYGHNDEGMKAALIDYLAGDGIVHGLDMATGAKERFIEAFHATILAPRGMNHRLMFPGPTGTNAVESALKIARKATGRRSVVSFTNAFHGMTLGALAVTGNGFKRAGAGVALENTLFVPFEGFGPEGSDGLTMFEAFLSEGLSGIEMPAAVIVDQVQGEGGINAASVAWLKRLEVLCRRFGMLLIVDDIQAGCGRTGTFFSFEPAGIRPDIVTLSKSLSGYGLPMALVLVRPEHDVFAPGEHNGTFRGNAAAFVTATEALRFWRSGSDLTPEVQAKGAVVLQALSEIAGALPDGDTRLRGRGLMRGVALPTGEMAARVCARAFEKGLVMETSGPKGEVLKVLCPLTIAEEDLAAGLAVLRSCALAEIEVLRRDAA